MTSHEFANIAEGAIWMESCRPGQIPVGQYLNHLNPEVRAKLAKLKSEDLMNVRIDWAISNQQR